MLTRGFSTPANRGPANRGPATQRTNIGDDKTEGFRITIKESEITSGNFEDASGTLDHPSLNPLTIAQTTALLARASEVKDEMSEKDKELKATEELLHRREKSLPPPAGGVTETKTYSGSTESAEVKPESTDDEAPRVVRYQPEGKIENSVPFISVVFSQPMTPISTLSSSSHEHIKVHITPELKGQWEWQGTQTLQFKPALGKFPNSSQFKVTVDKESKSLVSNKTLDKSYSFDFSTPTVKLISSIPNNNERSLIVRPSFLYVFNQDINQEAVFKVTKLTDKNGKKYKLQLLKDIKDKKIAPKQSEAFQNLLENSKLSKDSDLTKRFLLFTLSEEDSDLPTESQFTVVIGPRIPSAEGPLLSTETHTYKYTTYAPLRLNQRDMTFRVNKGYPSSIYFSFNNALDTSGFKPVPQSGKKKEVRNNNNNRFLVDKDMLTVDPDVDISDLNINGNYCTLYFTLKQIEGVSQAAGTEYKITLNRDAFKDIYGQSLVENNVVTFKRGKAYQQIHGGGNGLFIMDPFADPIYSISTVNHTEIRVVLYKINDLSLYEKSRWGSQFDYPRNQEYTPEEFVGITSKEKIVDQIIKIKYVEDELIHTPIDLTPALSGKFGNVVIYIEPTKESIAFGSDGNNNYRNPIVAWAQRTNLCADVFCSGDKLNIWVTDLTTGESVSDAIVKNISSDKEINKTDSDGLIVIPDATGGSIIIQKDDDTVFVASTVSSGLGFPVQYKWFTFDDRSLYKPKENVRVKGYVRKFTKKDGLFVREIPQDIEISYTVNDGRWTQIAEGKISKSDINQFGGFTIELNIPDNANLGDGSVQFNLNDLSSKQNNLDSTHSHSFKIQEFRRPEYKVNAQVSSSGPFVINGSTNVSVSAEYFSGGALPGAKSSWSVNTSKGSYSPPGWTGYVFTSQSDVQPLGRWGGRHNTNNFKRQTQYLNGEIDSQGNHEIQIKYEGAETPATPVNVEAEATVTDINQKTFTSKTSFIVHPSNYYVGIKPDKLAYSVAGQQRSFKIVVTDIDGKQIHDKPVTVTYGVTSDEDDDDSSEKKTTKTSVVLKEEEKDKSGYTFSFAPSKGGSWFVRVSVEDGNSQSNEAKLGLWVAGEDTSTTSEVDLQSIKLVADKKEYNVGDTAKVLAVSPIQGNGLLYILGQDAVILEKRSFKVADPKVSETIEVEIKQEYVTIGNVQVYVTINGVSDSGKKAPTFANGTVDLKIPALSRKLKIDVAPVQPVLPPGAASHINVQITPAVALPKSTDVEIAVVAIDDSLLSLSGFSMSDPLDTFYNAVSIYMSANRGRSLVILNKPQDEDFESADDIHLERKTLSSAGSKGFGMARGAPEGMMMFAATSKTSTFSFGGGGAPQGQDDGGMIAVRSNFDPTAIWAPAVQVHQNEAGKYEAVVKMQVPDSLTSYRVWVVAVAGSEYYGLGESSFRVSLPLMIRPSLPRFMNFGDTAKIPVIIQNTTRDTVDVCVGYRTGDQNRLALLTSASPSTDVVDSEGFGFTLGGNERTRILVPVKASLPGKAKFQVVVTGKYTSDLFGEFSDAVENEIPVYTPATTEAFATYGEIDTDKAVVKQSVILPSANDVYSNYGGLELSISSTILQTVTDSVLYLVKYKFDCTEQIGSRMLAILTLGDILNDFKASGVPSQLELKKIVEDDIQILFDRRQNSDGGFGWWSASGKSYPYVTVHLAYSVAYAKTKGIGYGLISEDKLNKLMEYLKNIITHVKENNKDFSWGQHNVFIVAYAFYVRSLFGENVKSLVNDWIVKEVKSTIDNSKYFGLDSLGMLLPLLDGEVKDLALKRILNSVSENAEKATFTTSYDDKEAGKYLVLSSDSKTSAIVLRGLIEAGNSSTESLIVKVLKGLLSARKSGRWNNTQDNVFSLIAVEKYYKAFETFTPKFESKQWLGQSYLGENKFEGRSTKQDIINVPMKYVIEQQNSKDDEKCTDRVIDVLVQKEGAGRLYYRLGLNYAPKSTSLLNEAKDRGFTITRTYSAVDDPSDVVFKDNSWNIKLGAKVRVKLTLVNTSRRYHVALVDYLPAGWEALNTALKGTASVPKSDGDDNNQDVGIFRRWCWFGPWYEHQNMRDERVEAFSTLLFEGVHEYEYVAQATTAGSFVAPPAYAEEMYSPEVFGRTALLSVVVSQS